ncbi:hypothetical protein [Hymenobacter sedentarius]|uniref:hypothetical protein n=1 Tax=Hymenobacter sedentarius TaxID=1411621 RepID=UPI0018EE4D6D|nr:hypothetical protein [Hymenobacter sedentarius]
MALFRNENNPGPIIRLYAVTVRNTNRWQQIPQYGALMPYTKYGATKVFYFAKSGPFPTCLQLSQPHFSPALSR